MTVFKALARTVISSGVKSAPWGVRRALIDALAEHDGDSAHAVAQFAKRTGISTFMAHGECGLIQASAADETLLPVYARTKRWAASTVSFLREAFPNDVGTYVDIGANIGLTTIPFAQMLGIKCFAFEPDPINFGHLTENVRRNCPHGNVQLFQMAAMERRGSLKFGLNPDGNPGDHRIISGETSRTTIIVEGAPVDEVIPSVSLPLAVKIDTQGAEPFVIAGARNLLSKADRVAIEFWPDGMKQMGGNIETVYALVRQFSRVVITPGEGARNAAIDSATLDPESAITLLRECVVRSAADSEIYWDISLSR